MTTFDQTVKVEISDLLIPVQGGIVSDVVLSIDQVNGLQNPPNIVPVTNFVKDFLSNYPNPNDFYENVNQNLTNAIVNNAPALGLAGTFDGLLASLSRDPITTLPYPFSSQTIETATGNTDQLVKVQLSDQVIPVQGGTVADATISLDYVENAETFANIVPVTQFVSNFLTNYPNPNDFYENISTNLTNSIVNNAPALGLAGLLNSVSVELGRSPDFALPHPFFSTSTSRLTGLSDQVVRVEIADLPIPIQGGIVSDVVLSIDQVNGLQNSPNIVPVTNFVKDFLSKYPNPNDFYENVNQNLTDAIVNNAPALGLAGTFDTLSVELSRAPIAILPYPFTSQTLETGTGNTDQLVKIQFSDLVIPVQGGTVADATISLDYVDNTETFANIIPLTQFVNDFLTDYPNPNDFYENVSTNLTSSIVNNAPALGLAGLLDSISVKLERSPDLDLLHPFSTKSIAIF
ncbi:MAG TPA: hypothetical protein V6D21_06355 [Candidatus Obscuribacterales bacterium]